MRQSPSSLKPAPKVLSLIACLIVATVGVHCECLSQIKGRNANSPAPESTKVRRTVAILFDSRLEGEASATRARRFVEMPLNHLGLIGKYVDIASRPTWNSVLVDDLLGVVTAFPLGSESRESEYLLNLLDQALLKDRKILLLGEVGFLVSNSFGPGSRAKQERILASLGLTFHNRHAFLDPELQVDYADTEFVKPTSFLEPMSGKLPLFTSNATEGRSIVKARLEGSPTTQAYTLVSTNRSGGVALGTSAFSEFVENDRLLGQRAWYVDPLKLFDAAFSISGIPRPDISTSFGRRIGVIAVDGPGFLASASSDGLLTAKSSVDVLKEKLVEKYPNALFNIAPLMAELDERWVGTPSSIKTARALYQLANVRPATGGYSGVGDFRDLDDSNDDERTEEASLPGGS